MQCNRVAHFPVVLNSDASNLAIWNWTLRIHHGTTDVDHSSPSKKLKGALLNYLSSTSFLLGFQTCPILTLALRAKAKI